MLLSDAPRPRPWLHLDALRALADAIYTSADAREEADDDVGRARVRESTQTFSTGASTKDAEDSGALIEEDFVPAREWFERQKADIGSTVGLWSGWSDELDGVRLRYCRARPLIH